MIEVEKYIILFFVYSVLGWTMEVLDILIENRKLVNRGFLLGPYCPIYGAAGVAMGLISEYVKPSITIVFLACLIVCSFFEYMISVIMEKVFHARWWDYSDLKFNINGRICLKNMIAFGLLGCLIIYVLHPFFTDNLDKMPENIVYWTSLIMAVVLLLDTLVSFIIIKNIKITADEVMDNTEEVKKQVKNNTEKVAKKVKDNTEKVARKVKDNTIKVSKKVKDNTEKVTRKVKDNTEKVAKRVIDDRKIFVRKVIDNKDEITKKVKDIVSKRSAFARRIFRAFPEITFIRKKPIKLSDGKDKKEDKGEE